MTDDAIRVGLLLRPAQYEWLRRKAYVDNTKMSEVMRQLIDAAMKGGGR